MNLLDSDTLTWFTAGHPRLVKRVLAATDIVGTTIISRIEILRGRFDFLMKAADGQQLQRAQGWLEQSERDLNKFAVVPIDEAAAARFDQLRVQRNLRKIGRADLLIACIALANDATLVTRNLKHFRQVPNLKVENWVD
jgi:tRNA(fMet)-specific endonuclease VapC